MSLGENEFPEEAKFKGKKTQERVEGQVGWKEIMVVKEMERPLLR
jgi:hypothetical protein